jgi:hypothetical protein
MPDKSDPLSKTFYDRAIQEKIGEAFFSVGYDLSQPLPRRLRTLLNRLNQPDVQDVASGSQRREGGPAEDEWAGRK